MQSTHIYTYIHTFKLIRYIKRADFTESKMCQHSAMTVIDKSDYCKRCGKILVKLLRLSFFLCRFSLHIDIISHLIKRNWLNWIDKRRNGYNWIDKRNGYFSLSPSCKFLTLYIDSFDHSMHYRDAQCIFAEIYIFNLYVLAKNNPILMQ